MQQQLDAANTELQELKQGAAMTSNTNNRDGSSGVQQGPTRGRGIKQSAERAERADKTSTAFYGGLIDQSEIVDKRIEQLSKEKRELIAKNLEGNKEKMELSQKLIQAEKEVASLKTKLTKVTLDKERLERKIALGMEKSKCITQEDENIPPNLSSSAF
jgi:Cu/Ag efflux protein CusF